MIKELQIEGFRGFGVRQTIKFALPDGKTNGSGITFLVGAKNSGKTTILEAIKAFNGDSDTTSPSFSEDKRNKFEKGSHNVSLSLLEDNSTNHTIISNIVGTSETSRWPRNPLSFYFVPSRRSFKNKFIILDVEDSFNRNLFSMNFNKLENQRSVMLPKGFADRVFQAEKSRKKDVFLRYMKRILGEYNFWMLEKDSEGYYSIRFMDMDGVWEKSEDVGDGIWSAFVISDALYDAEANSTIVIDEPELSLHPSAQKRLMQILLEESKTKQIIVSTHSPYFISWTALFAGANLVRSVKMDDGNCYCFALNKATKESFRNIVADINNPHVLGLEANEVFFLTDNIILVEGQEDVVIFDRVQKALQKTFEGDFFGWGAGGAEKIEKVLMLFHDLNYENIAVILDGDKVELKEQLEANPLFAQYHFFILSADDIRDKKGRIMKAKNGWTQKNGEIKEEYKKDAIRLIDDINTAFKKVRVSK